MASDPYQSPYKSNLLRFVIGHYQKGVNRHRQAVRQARAIATRGIETGVALSLMPVYTVVHSANHVAKIIERKWKEPWTNNCLPGVSARTAKLLDFSDFSGSLISLELSDDTEVVSGATSAERSMARLLLSVGRSLSFKQVSQISTEDSSVAKLLHWGRHLIRGLFQLGGVNAASRLGQLPDAPRSAVGQITGVASDLETRSLQLVLSHSVVWEGLSDSQQAHLQGQMVAFMGEGQVDRFRRSDSLTRPAWSFWVELLHAISKLWRYGINIQFAKLDSYRKKLPEVKLMQPGAADGAQRLVGDAMSNALPSTVQGTLRLAEPINSLFKAAAVQNPMDRENAYFIEADVIAATYIEHPLEKLLKWVDRILLWIERQWQKWTENR
ncbi:MAG: hypothetical protein WA885_17185 [Phormidesmis sp.]